MKKIMIIILATLMISTLCSCEKTEMTKKQNNGKDVYAEYSEKEPLFICSESYDDDDMICFYNYRGKLLNYNNYIGFRAKNGLAIAVDPSTDKVGFVDRNGIFIIEPKYIDGTPFSDEGVAVVKIENEQGEELCGVIDSEGKTVVDFIYPEIFSFFKSGYAVFRVDKENGTDEYGDTMVDNLFGIMDTKGKIIVEPTYTNIYYVYDEYFVAEKEGLDKIFDFNGKSLSDDLNTLNHCEDIDKLDGVLYYLFECNEQGVFRYGFYNNDNQVKKTECFNEKDFVNYHKAKNYEFFSNKSAATLSGYASGAKKDGKTVVPPEYDQIYEANDYIVGIKYQDKKGKKQTMDIYNSKFKCTAKDLHFNYDYSIGYITNGFQVPNGFFAIYKESPEKYSEDNLHGIIDEKGNVIVDAKFKKITLCTYEDTSHFPKG
ncbi:MAG: WG repeat-containing protein [Clostridia bacterium]|nr:WG repeat-containing protein [Clostridia bacterium]